MYSPWEHFSLQELSCPCCGKVGMDPEFMEKLVELRKHCDFPFKITSAYRCEKHNRKVNGKSSSAHLEGRAVDIQCYGDRAFDVVTVARNFGFTGIGIQQKGAHNKRFIHIDDLESDIRPWVWSY